MSKTNCIARADTYVHMQHRTAKRLSSTMGYVVHATHVRQLHLRRSAYVSTPVQQYLIKLPTKTSDHFDNDCMDGVDL